MALFGSTTSASTAAGNTTGDISKDVALNQPPDDSISDLSFSPTADFLAVASWDKRLRIYEVSEQGQSQGKAEITFDGPVLNCSWSHDGTKVAGASADKSAKIIDLASNSTTAQQVAAHDQPIRTCRFIESSGNPMLVTGSWDKTVKYWDLRSSTPVANIENQERVYSMDVKNKLLVIATADRYINIVNLDEPTKFYKTLQSPLKYQTRVVSCFTDAMGFAVGSIEGRCAIQYVEDKDANLNFSFKCHRETPSAGPNRDVSNVYAVNAISFHPQHGTFSTAGSDGTFHFWDKDAKHRLKGYPAVGGTISATDFSRNGNIFAYAVSYDWSRGYTNNTTQTPNKVMLHPIAPEEVKPRAGAKKR
ncbi:RNA export factor gle2 [Endocarpon pusillum]|uniref:WD40 repeat protein poxJ n=1 Tax=Endocarpon pusillum TaxID=364733 RepID=A0A8H7E0L0_9EURO|nr:RNA export factor gle2 [Endocarpon pusillum]